MPRGPQFRKLSLDKKVPDPGAEHQEYYYTPKKLAGLLNVSPSTLSYYRQQKIGPKFRRIGYRSCRYLKTDVQAYLAEREGLSTAEQPTYPLSPTLTPKPASLR